MSARPPEGASLVRPVSPVFLAVPAVLALALAALWFGPGPAAGWRQWQAPQPQPPNLDDVQAAALRFNPAAGAAYPQVLERPLLNPARRPQASASAGPEAAPPTAIEEATMQGIVAGATLTGVFLEEKGEARFVRIGEKVGDWALESIRGREIVFRRGAEQRKIELAPANPESDQGKGAPAAQGQHWRGLAAILAMKQAARFPNDLGKSLGVKENHHGRIWQRTAGRQGLHRGHATG